MQITNTCKFIHRLKEKLQAIKYVLLLGRMTHSWKKAYEYLKSQGSENKITLESKGLFLTARKEDWCAIREVLIDDEYAIIGNLFTNDEKPKIVDLGANIGCFGWKVFSCVPQASVFSVEATPDTAKILEYNRISNPNYNWIVSESAVWKENTELRLTRTTTSAGNRVDLHSTGPVIKGVRLDKLLSNVGWSTVDLIKIDIEGAESEVIPAVVDILKTIKYLIIEIHNDRINGNEITTILDDCFTYSYKLTNRVSTKPLYLYSNQQVHSLEEC